MAPFLAGSGGTVRLRNLHTGDTTHILTAQVTRVNAVQSRPDGSLLATASDDGTVRLWNPNTGAAHVLIGHTGPVEAVAFSPDGSLLATTSEDRVVRIWNPDTGETTTMMRTESSLLSCTWTPDGRALYSGAAVGLFAYDLH
ncbi:hypothetical protein OIA45_40690 (plasmid) [Streptomyces chartreusis]|uniref:WD40 repeat domain-containing protein n=1 Tax=Streptomyces chartreusis TaxID=1969 RepID=UPI002F9176B5|nr:hypothetical protein OIA45_40690 [Streptomyces chartreusis]